MHVRGLNEFLKRFCSCSANFQFTVTRFFLQETQFQPYKWETCTPHSFTYCHVRPISHWTKLEEVIFKTFGGKEKRFLKKTFFGVIGSIYMSFFKLPVQYDRRLDLLNLNNPKLIYNISEYILHMLTDGDLWAWWVLLLDNNVLFKQYIGWQSTQVFPEVLGGRVSWENIFCFNDCHVENKFIYSCFGSFLGSLVFSECGQT